MAADELSGAVHQLSSRRIFFGDAHPETQLGDLPETVQVTQPADQWVPTGAGLVQIPLPPVDELAIW